MANQGTKKVLIVEDEADIAALIKMYLEKDGYQTAYARTGVEGWHALTAERPDMVILDLMLPEMDGLELCKKLRNTAETAFLPVIMLTAKAEESDTIVGLELGADDYVTKPFSPKALLSRVKALFRRLERQAEDMQTFYHYGQLVMDLSRHEVRFGGREVPLTAKEFGLLEHFLRHPGRVLTRDVLLNAVWGYDYYGTTRTVDVHVRRLKLKLPCLNEAVISVKSLGYKLIEAPARR
jgi:DNA-binding response OmpR family regulator